MASSHRNKDSFIRNVSAFGTVPLLGLVGFASVIVAFTTILVISSITAPASTAPLLLMLL